MKMDRFKVFEWAVIVYLLAFAISRWFPAPPSTDAMTQWQATQGITDHEQRLRERWSVAEQLEPTQLASAFHQAVLDNDHEAIAALGDLWTSKHPQSLVEDLLARPANSPALAKGRLTAVFRRWSERDTSAALQALPTLRRSKLPFGSSLEPNVALRYLSQYPSNISQVLACIGLGENPYNLHGQETFTGNRQLLAESLQAAPESDKRNMLERWLFRSLNTNEPGFLTEWLSVMHDLGPSMNASKLRAIMQAVADDKVTTPGYSIMGWFPAEPFSIDVAQQALNTVLEEHKETLLAGSYSNTGSSEYVGPGKEARALSRSFAIPIRIMARVDPQIALAAVKKIPFLAIRTKLIYVIADQWALADPHAAHDWTDTIPTGEVRSRAQQYVMAHWPK